MINRPIYVNLFHLKSINGMFYYALDYLPKSGYQILCNSKNADISGLVPESCTVIKLNYLSYFFFYLRAMLFRFSIFTPTPHPLPFLSKQLIVLHDSYPFRLGRFSFLKKALFSLSLQCSKTKVGYINFCDAKAFLMQLKLPDDRCFFMPNKPPFNPLKRKLDFCSVDNILHVGAVGTDSLKKNYETLFVYLQEISTHRRLKLYLFGQDNAYVQDLRHQFPSCNFVVIDSRLVTLDEFLVTLDLLVSTAKGEGFCRPVALALQMGIPCLLIDDPVLKEFYEHSAIFFKDFNEFKSCVSSILSGNYEVMAFDVRKLNSQFTHAKRELYHFLE